MNGASKCVLGMGRVTLFTDYTKTILVTYLPGISRKTLMDTVVGPGCGP